MAGPWALEAQRLLAEDWGVAADVWSATSWTELRRDALACDEHNLLNPDAEPRVPYVTQALSDGAGPGRRGVSDCMRAVPDQIAQWVPGDWSSLGTDGFGLSDTRSALRRHFHVDADSITLAVLTSWPSAARSSRGAARGDRPLPPQERRDRGRWRREQRHAVDGHLTPSSAAAPREEIREGPLLSASSHALE